ncbi:uncharacterized protein LOC142237514 [Haematobia irritans]|uniref:uncharacterized protein LOC142237514 n=1 Tax=Haematobia irritans TaxID=7368 RepID=UPI003F4FB187
MKIFILACFIALAAAGYGPYYPHGFVPPPPPPLPPQPMPWSGYPWAYAPSYAAPYRQQPAAPIYEPLCGVLNGAYKTFFNFQEFAETTRNNHNFQFVCYGPCPDVQDSCTSDEPLCATDGVTTKTFKNACALVKEKIATQGNWFQVSPGPCPGEEQPPVPQPPAEEQPPAPQPPVEEQPPAPQPPFEEQPPVPQPPAEEQPPAPQPPTEEQPPVPQPPAEEQPPASQPPTEEQPPAPQPPTEEQPPVPQPPVEEQPPVPQPPAEEQPPAPQTPVEEQPPAPQPPVEEQPPAPQTPVEEQPAAPPAPAEEQPAAPQAPVAEEPAPPQPPVDEQPPAPQAPSAPVAPQEAILDIEALDEIMDPTVNTQTSSNSALLMQLMEMLRGQQQANNIDYRVYQDNTFGNYAERDIYVGSDRNQNDAIEAFYDLLDKIKASLLS